MDLNNYHESGIILCPLPKGLGFLPLLSNLGVFIKGYIYLVVYIDNLLIVGPDKSEI